jgi:hypothetical protein
VPRKVAAGFIVCDSRGVPLVLSRYKPFKTGVLMYGTKKATVFTERRFAQNVIDLTRREWLANEPSEWRDAGKGRDLNFFIVRLDWPV